MHGIILDTDTATDAKPDEIIIGDIMTGHSEAFTNVTLPAPAGDKLHEVNINVKVDTGAGGNILPLRLFRQMYPEQIDPQGLPTGLTPTPTRLFAYNGTRIPQHGALDVWTRWKPHNQRPRCLCTRWYIADTQGPAILGLPASQRLGVVTMNCAVCLRTSPSQHQQADTATSTQKELPIIWSAADLQREFPDRFEGIGRFAGKYHITLKADVKPVIHPPRKCPIAMKPHVQAELECLEHLEVIRKVDEPTNWVSSLAYAWKPNGKVRACLNAKELNNCIKRDHHRTPTVEEITHNFAGSTVFTKVDGTASYYCVELDEESQLLTTFNSPFGRYCLVLLSRHAYLQGSSAVKTSSRRRLTKSWNSVQVSLGLLMTSAFMERTYTSTTKDSTTSWKLPAHVDLCLTLTNAVLHKDRYLSLDMSMTNMAAIQTLQRLKLSMPCPVQPPEPSFRSSLVWSPGWLLSYPTCLRTLRHSENFSVKILSSPGMSPMMQLFIASNS